MCDDEDDDDDANDDEDEDGDDDVDAVFLSAKLRLCLSQGSFQCGQCKEGFVGNQTSGCFVRRTCALLGYDPCDVNAHCVMERSSDVSCVVRTHITCRTLIT